MSFRSPKKLTLQVVVMKDRSKTGRFFAIFGGIRAMENRTKPSPSPALSPGERENLRTLRQGSGNVDFDPTHRSSAPRQLDHHLHDRTPWRTRPFQMSRVVLPLPWGEGGVRGKGLACRLRLSFQPLAPVSIPPKIARNLPRFVTLLRCGTLPREF